MRQSQRMEDKVISAVQVFASSIGSTSEVAADMSALIDVTSQLGLHNFDYWERLIRSEFSQALKESTSVSWSLRPEPGRLLTWLDLISRDGYRREQTLRVLYGAAPNAFFFSLAVRRLNDWVPDVREAARENLPKIATITNPEYVVEALCIVLSNWNSWGRINAADKQVLFQIIAQEHIADALRSKLMSSACGPMPALFSQLGRTSILDGKVEDIARHAVQPSLRAKAYRSLFEARITWTEGRAWEWTDIRYCEGKLTPVISERKLSVQTPLPELLQQSAGDRSSIVRRVSAEILIRELDNPAIRVSSLAERFAADKSKAVSERGVFALKELEKSKQGNLG